MSTSDCGPLQEMRKDLTGDCCSWPGVTCDPNNRNRVTYVRWANSRLTGTIPPSIGGLTNLTELDLSSNQLSGSIPAALGNLKNLRSLDLDSNKFTGAIPEELGGMASISWLDLGSNDLTGRIPDSFTQLPKLSILYVYHNRLTGPLTKLPNPASSCYMLSSFDEHNDFGCFPQGATGKCAADLVKNKVPECDANGNPPAGSATSTGGSLSPNLGSSPTPRSSAGSNPSWTSPTIDSSSTSSFPILAVTLPVAIVIGGLFGWFMVLFIRRRRAQIAQKLANHRVPITITMPNGNTATVNVGATAVAMAGVSQQQPYPPTIPMPKPTLVPTSQVAMPQPQSPAQATDGGEWKYVKINTIRVEQDETMQRPLPALPPSPALNASKPHDDEEELYLPPPAPGPRPEDDIELALPSDKPMGRAKED